MQEFTAEDVETATEFYRQITDPTAKGVLDFLIDHAGKRYESWEITAALGQAQHRDFGRATYAIGETASRLGRTRPWHESQMGFLMSVEQADVMRRAREQAS